MGDKIPRNGPAILVLTGNATEQTLESTSVRKSESITLRAA